MTYNVEGIILKYRDIGEFDRIYSILTREHGKVDAWAQGVRKPQSKLVAHLQPLYLCDLMFARGRRFDRVAQVRIINRFPELWADLEKMSKAVYAASLVDLVLRPGTKEPTVFDLFLSTLTLLAQGDGALELLFSIKLLKETGFSPELHYCVLCKKEVEGLSRLFDAVRGGVVCGGCTAPPLTPPRQGGEINQFPPLTEGRPGGVGVFPVSSLTLETLETILASALSRLEMPEQVRRELTTIAGTMMQAHFGEPPKARYFMDQLSMPLSTTAQV